MRYVGTGWFNGRPVYDYFMTGDDLVARKLGESDVQRVWLSYVQLLDNYARKNGFDQRFVPAPQCPRRHKKLDSP